MCSCLGIPRDLPSSSSVLPHAAWLQLPAHVTEPTFFWPSGFNFSPSWAAGWRLEATLFDRGLAFKKDGAACPSGLSRDMSGMSLVRPLRNQSMCHCVLDNMSVMDIFCAV